MFPRHKLARFAVSAAALGILALAVAACEDNDDGAAGPSTTPPPTSTPLPATPTPVVVKEAPGAEGFQAFAPKLDAALRAGDTAFFSSRVHAPNQLIRRSLWKSEARDVPPDGVVKELSDVIARAKKEKSDQFGTGAARLHAFNIAGGKVEAVFTSIAAAPVEAGGPARGDVRSAFVTEWQFVDGTWKITSLMSAYTLAEDLLVPQGDGIARLPAFDLYEGQGRS